jgi:acetyl esterase/lipase
MSADSDVSIMQRYAAELGCVVVSVDYRLAPETRFPGSLEDNYAALEWFHANAVSLGVDPHWISVSGASAVTASTAGTLARASSFLADVICRRARQRWRDA